MTPLPRVTVHYAQSLDGRIATRSGDARWISGDATLRLAHQLRAQHAVVLVGVGTVIADDPRLTVRLVPGRSPRRVIVDSSLRLPLDANVLTDGAAATVVATTERAPSERVRALDARSVEVLRIGETADGRVDLSQLLCRLARAGDDRILIEGGRGIITSALRANLVDRLIVCIAPKLIGTGVEAVGDLNIRRIAEAMTFRTVAFDRHGDDLVFDGWLNRPAREQR